ncbi:unnamed protein product [Acanthoscelides obtectus]|uniref:Uncharacterized protein n=1 Tax=Acanthoscelides obtectus TaxID=200917 RepID=A0A9P0KHR6_ACAOB|nr:unnamed protein product [Acanthoscelides obtectus]CAK1656499.1 hypothetical protein AOBTE_LOCUS19753 [Acanthoscelides obtectus]
MALVPSVPVALRKLCGTHVIVTLKAENRHFPESYFVQLLSGTMEKTRSAKMLSMVGIKLKKGPTSEEWKIVPQATNADSTSVTPKNIERASESEADKENTSPQVPEASVRSKKF